MANPSGTVTFLFTDIEGSTQMWQRDPIAMDAAIERHDSILRDVVETHGGVVFKMTGDGIAAAFQAASSGLLAAIDAEMRLSSETWPTDEPIRVRMALHTGEARQRGGDYFGTSVNRTARLMAAAHGGQVLLSAAAAGILESEVALVDLGEHRLRSLDRPIRIFQLGEQSFPPIRSQGAEHESTDPVRTATKPRDTFQIQAAEATPRLRGPRTRGGRRWLLTVTLSAAVLAVAAAVIAAALLLSSGPSDTALLPVSASASSFTRGYLPGNAIDGDGSTSWQANHASIGQTIVLHYGTPENVAKIVFLLGAQDAAFTSQPRPRLIEVTIDGAAPRVVAFELKDTYVAQTFAINGQEVTTLSVAVKSVYPSSTGDSVSIAEIQTFSKN